MNKIVIPSVLTLFFAVGCSVQTPKVVNRPPRISDAGAKDIAHNGTLLVKRSSVFFWPKWSEQEAEEKAEIVRRASIVSDKALRYNAIVTQLWGVMQKSNCINSEWVETKGGDSKGLKATDPLNWKPQAAGLTEEQTKARTACLKSDQKRMASLQSLAPLTKKDASGKNEIDKAAESFNATIPMENHLPVATDSSIEVRPDGKVNISLADFAKSGKVFSTAAQDQYKVHKASYDPETRTLVFVVPELSTDGNPTGRKFAFRLERTLDLYSEDDIANSGPAYAKFSGDVALLSQDGTILKTGAAQFGGPFAKAQ